MNREPTPETDNQVEYAKDCGMHEEVVLAHVARKLELERDEALVRLRAARKLIETYRPCGCRMTETSDHLGGCPVAAELERIDKVLYRSKHAPRP